MNSDSPELWCANLGTVNFFVSGMKVDLLLGESRKITFKPGNSLLVPVGGMKHMNLKDPEEKFGSNRPGNAEIKLTLQGPSGEVETDAKAYHLWFHEGRYRVRDPERGFQGLLPIYCPKCKTRAANFDVEGLIATSDCRKEIGKVERELERTCPQHASSNSRVTCDIGKPYNVPRVTLNV